MDMGKIETIDETTTNILMGHPHKVILFNDEDHDMYEVCTQIEKATGYNSQHAWAIMMEANNTGRAIVFSGGLERCEHVEAILAEIRLSTKIEPA